MLKNKHTHLKKIFDAEAKYQLHADVSYIGARICRYAASVPQEPEYPRGLKSAAASELRQFMCSCASSAQFATYDIPVYCDHDSEL